LQESADEQRLPTEATPRHEVRSGSADVTRADAGRYVAINSKETLVWFLWRPSRFEEGYKSYPNHAELRTFMISIPLS